MKQKITAVLLISLSGAGSAAAAEIGLGISAKSDNGLIYFPIDVSPGFRVEPHLRYSTDDSGSLQTVPPTATIAGLETESLEVGLGIFGLLLPKESLRVYYGGRVGYVNVHTELRIDNGTVTIRDSDTSTGYRIAPTLGFEYLFNRHFTLGGEIGWFYERLEGDDRFGSAVSRFEGERNGTSSYLILRYFF